ncbi:MAG: acyltransferase [Burkholderiales bacterium]|nr:acyltransferase [Burkholderiales bacterium]
MQNVKKRIQIEWLQSLRGVAAVGVVLYHYLGKTVETGKYSYLFGIGRYGVPLFFIISGIVMYISVLNYQPQLKSVVKFLINRLIRIWPLYFIATFIQNSDKVFSVDMLKSMMFYPLRHGDIILGPPVLSLQGWTLNFEMYFYLIFALALFFKHRIFIVSIWSFFVLIVLPKILTGGFIFSFYIVKYPPLEPVYLNLIMLPFILYFLFGCFIGKVYLINNNFNNSDHWLRKAKYLIKPLLVLSMFIFVYASYVSYITQSVVSGIGLLATILLLLTVVFGEKLRIINVPPRVLLLLGNMSYSIYVWHSLPMTLLSLDTDFSIIKFIFSISLTLIISYVSYLLIEVKLTKFLKIKLLSRFG